MTFLIAARDDADAVEGCLDALHRQRYPADRVELLLLDGQSTDDTVAVVAHVT